jgi:hypothetical protein
MGQDPQWLAIASVAPASLCTLSWQLTIAENDLFERELDGPAYADMLGAALAAGRMDELAESVAALQARPLRIRSWAVPVLLLRIQQADAQLREYLRHRCGCVDDTLAARTLAELDAEVTLRTAQLNELLAGGRARELPEVCTDA